MAYPMLALRYSDDSAPEGGTVEAHQRVMKAEGYVWLGKRGKPIASSRVAEMSKEIEARGSIEVILARRTKWHVVMHAAEITAVAAALPADELSRVPAYYRAKAGAVGTWFRVVDFRKIQRDESAVLVVASSGKPLFSAVRNSMCTNFWVNSSARGSGSAVP